MSPYDLLIWYVSEPVTYINAALLYRNAFFFSGIGSSWQITNGE